MSIQNTLLICTCIKEQHISKIKIDQRFSFSFVLEHYDNDRLKTDKLLLIKPYFLPFKTSFKYASTFLLQIYLRRGHVSYFSVIVLMISAQWLIQTLWISAMFIFQFCPKLQDKHCIKHYDYNNDRKARYKIDPLVFFA